MRNVWVEGPEVAYDRAKASLSGLLQKEAGFRKTEAKRSLEGDNKFGPRELVPQLVHEMRGSHAEAKASSAAAASGGRLGLVTFRGARRDDAKAPARGTKHW